LNATSSAPKGVNFLHFFYIVRPLSQTVFPTPTYPWKWRTLAYGRDSYGDDSKTHSTKSASEGTGMSGPVGIAVISAIAEGYSINVGNITFHSSGHIIPDHHSSPYTAFQICLKVHSTVLAPIHFSSVNKLLPYNKVADTWHQL
jgi:hypothetical protein